MNNLSKYYQLPIYQSNINIESELKNLTRPKSKCIKCKYNPKIDKTSYLKLQNIKKNKCSCINGYKRL